MKPLILVANTETQTLNFLNSTFQELNSFESLPVNDINQFLEAPPQTAPLLSIVDAQSDIGKSSEWVQTLKMTYQTPILMIHGPQQPIDFAIFKKNGADQMIHFHYDREFIVDMILELAPVEFGENIPLIALQSLDLSEIHPEMEINFDLYVHLPSNQKTILLRKKGSRVEQKVIDRIRDSHQHLYFKKTETKLFLEYARTALTMENSNLRQSLTEKWVKSKHTVFEMMSEFFSAQQHNFETGKKILERCRSVLSDYDLLRPRSPEHAFHQMSLLVGHPRTFYHDAICVSNYAAMLGHVLQLKAEEIESLALAGLLHNIGLSEVTGYTLGIDVQSLSEDMKKKFLAYPERSVHMVKSQKVPLSQEVSTMIEQHQEFLDGSGFPHQLKRDKIHMLSRLLRIAILFQEYTGLLNNVPGKTFSAAMDSLKEEVSSGRLYDGELLLRLHQQYKQKS